MNLTKPVTNLSPQQIGGMLTAVKRGDASYTYFARKYKTSVHRIKRICNKHGVFSIHEEPEQLKQSREKNKSFFDRLLGR